MTAYYVDTSTLAKYYLAERGTGWTRSLLRPSSGNITVICETTPIEMFSLLARHQRTGMLAAINAATIQANFLQHVETRYLVQPVDSHIFIEARLLVTRHTLRTLDAIQLASALHASNVLGEPLTFITADNGLLGAAIAEGFSADNPLHHP